MLIAPLSVSTPLRPIRKGTPSFAARSSYQTQRERGYLNATLGRVADLTPKGGVGFRTLLKIFVAEILKPMKP